MECGCYLYTEQSVTATSDIEKHLDEQVLSHFKINKVIQAVTTQIHYLSLGPPDACAY